MYSRDNSGYSAISHQSRVSIPRSNEPKQTKKNKRVQVWARVRPTAYFAHDMIELLPDGKSINIHMKRDARKGVVNNQILDWSFRMDGIFHNSSQDQVFETVSSDIVTSALDGYNGTMLCYGQTGAGKTFTMTGATENYRHRGLIPRSITQLFKEIEERPEFGITVRISYLEIYNETMFDLLSTLPDSWSQIDQQSMVITENEDGVYVKGLSCHLVQNEEEALNLLFEGETNRAIAAHSLNKISSRSHCIFTVYIETRSRVQSNARYTVSKLNFVDLAGSERLGKTKSEGKTQTEAMYINKSLSFLEQVIIALADRKREHIPFRQSKLTHCLKDSIGGNSNTLLIANIWGEGSQIEETVSTMRFATRMMCVATEPAINEVFDPAVLVKKLQKEIMHLKNELAMHDTLTNRSQVVYDPLSEQQKYEIKQQVRRYLEGNLDEIDIINIRQIQGVFESFREIYQQMEKDVEERLRNKFALIDRTDPAAIAAAQQAGIPITDEGILVGESDSTGFGVGVAPRSAKAEPSSVVQLRKKEKEKEKKKMGREAKSPVAGRAAGSPAQSTKGDKREGSPSVHTPQEKDKKDDAEDRTSPTSSAGGISKIEKQARPSESSRPSTAKSKFSKSPLSDGRTKTIPQINEIFDLQILEEKIGGEEEEEREVGEERPCTPPTRTAAFEEFKQEKGSEINRILIENKEILAKKKQQYAETARGINQTKVDIDGCRMKLDRLKEEREANGPVYNEDGDVVISEDEFVEIKKLKDLKQKYRTDFEDLKMLKAEVQYCQKLVDQCRQRLIQEFDNWYAENFLNQVDEGQQSSMAAGHGIRPGVFIPFNPNALPEDEQEKFDRLQTELLMHDPDSAAYYNAKLRTERRKTYETAMSQPQPAYRKPGTPTMRIRNQPPNMLQVQN